MSNEITNELKSLEVKSYAIKQWEKYGKIFREYFDILERPESCKYDQVEFLMRRIENIRYNCGFQMTFVTCKNIMVGNLRRILNSKLSAVDIENRVI